MQFLVKQLFPRTKSSVDQGVGVHDIRKLESHSFATTFLDKRVQGALCLFVDWVLSKQYSHKIYQKRLKANGKLKLICTTVLVLSWSCIKTIKEKIGKINYERSLKSGCVFVKKRILNVQEISYRGNSVDLGQSNWIIIINPRTNPWNFREEILRIGGVFWVIFFCFIPMKISQYL